ncbi:unnamed protein product [Gongylonema pulchrum]|uniref:Uncharacterized protein n=1 Tax=Gongylonema pulchrum TaxID=637853 RepID=A0A183D9B8_9BILA|nr:unnamed protein product [Gongylonema pulchrum]
MLYAHAFLGSGAVAPVNSRHRFRDMSDAPRISAGLGLTFLIRHFIRLELNYVIPLSANIASTEFFEQEQYHNCCRDFLFLALDDLISAFMIQRLFVKVEERMVGGRLESNSGFEEVRSHWQLRCYMSTKRTLTFVTGNVNKVNEVRAILGDLFTVGIALGVSRLCLGPLEFLAKFLQTKN